MDLCLVLVSAAVFSSSFMFFVFVSFMGVVISIYDNGGEGTAFSGRPSLVLTLPSFFVPSFLLLLLLLLLSIVPCGPPSLFYSLVFRIRGGGGTFHRFAFVHFSFFSHS